MRLPIYLVGAFLLAITSCSLAAAPPEESLWGREPVDASTSRRGEVCLNGLWRFMPAIGRELKQGGGEWGYIQVPGDWRNTETRPGIVKKGAGAAWSGSNPGDAPAAWYERTFTVPAEWKGRGILIDFRRISTDAVVYVNGRKCGAVSWPSASVEITDAVTPGQSAVVRVLVAATADEAEGRQFTTSADPTKLKSKGGLESRGIIGDVVLRSRPRGEHIRDVFVQTSTREKMVLIDVEIAGMKKAGAVRLTARMLNEKGEEEARFVRDVGIEAKDSQVVSAAWRWTNPRLWDFGKPNLYTVQLEARGLGLDDAYAQEFGFREFWIDGRKFYLNGTELRLRPTMGLEQWSNVAGTPEVIDGLIDSQIKAGFNIEEHWPIDLNRRGTPNYREIRAERADRKGWAIMGGLVRLNEFLVDSKYKAIWDQGDTKKKWEQAMLNDMKRLRNHPSILMWSTSANFFAFGQDQNPVMLGKMDWRPSDQWAAKMWKFGKEAADIVRKYDPTRPIFNHHGGFVGDLHTVNLYLCTLPLQEREEWPSYWAEHGKAPFVAIEFGTPLHCSFMRGREEFDQNIHSEPLMTEFCAIYLGREAYAQEPKAYRDEIRKRFVKDQSYQNWQGNAALETAPAFQAVQYLFSRNTWRSWRTWGVTGGMVPWNMGHGWSRGPEYWQKITLPSLEPGRRGTWFDKVNARELHYLQPPAWKTEPGGQAIMENDGETLAWIAGPKEAFTAKDHSFVAGQRVQKQIVFINDARQPLELRFLWSAEFDKNQWDGEPEKPLVLQPAQTLMLPLEFDLPADVAAPMSGTIKLTATIGSHKHEDRFAFRIFPKPHPAGEELVIFDPVGHTTKMLQQQGYKLRAWTGQKDVPMVLIGWKALSRGHKPPASLEAYVKAGGRAVIFAQNRDWLRNTIGLRVAEHLARRAFPVSDKHPAVAGLNADDLRDWTGESTLIESRPDYFKPGTKLGPRVPYPYYGWHWGNRGVVTSAAIEKPHRSGWRPILECEFDLAYTPLMELDYGQGRLIYCTLDLEDHASADPASGVLLRQMLAYAQTAPLHPRARKTVLLGDNADAAKLDALGVLYQRADKIDPSTDLAIIGAGYDLEQVRPWVESGGRALVLPRRKADAGLGVRLELQPAFHGSLNVPDWAECVGLSASDLRCRTDAEAWTVASGGQIGADGLLSRVAVGRGVAIFCQIDPDQLNADQQTYLRYTRWRETRATCQVLANLGAAFKADARVFATGSQPSADAVKKSGFYHGDYREDFARGDDPYRYYRW